MKRKIESCVLIGNAIIWLVFENFLLEKIFLMHKSVKKMRKN